NSDRHQKHTRSLPLPVLTSSPNKGDLLPHKPHENSFSWTIPASQGIVLRYSDALLSKAFQTRDRMSKVVLVNPANTTVGYSVITPRWLYVIAGATPAELVGDPVIIDEPITPFNPDEVGPGDIVGVGIHTGNCRPGYRVVREAKQRGA